MEYPQEPISLQETSTSKKPFVVAVLFFMLVALGAASFYLYQRYFMQGETPYSKESDAYLLREGDALYNRLYREARLAKNDLKDYRTAAAKYEEALELAQLPGEIGQIKFELAQTRTNLGEYGEAVRLLKEVAIATDIPNLLRSAAIEEMGKMYYNEYDTRILQSIFLQGDEPFRGFFVPGDGDASIKNLFEFGSSIYPAAYMELRLAYWYAREFANRARGQEVQTELSNEDILRLIGEKLANADADIQAIRNVYVTDPRIASAFLRKAVVAAQLERGGNQTLLGEAESHFQTAIQEARVSNSSDVEAWALYNLSLHLVYNHMPERRGQLVEILSSFYDGGNRYTDTGVIALFKKVAAAPPSSFVGHRRDISLLIAQDPLFEEFLKEQFGWSSGDQVAE